MFQVIDGVIHQRSVGGDYEQVEGTTTMLVEEVEGGKPVVRSVKVPNRQWRQRVVLRPVPEADATFKTAGGDLLTYKQAVARIADRAACLSVYGDEPVDPLIMKALKPET